MADHQPGQRVPPHDLGTEAALLGAALIDEQAASVAATLPPDAFYSPAHAHIADAIRHLADTGSPVDPHTVTNRLTATGVLDVVGGHQTLLDCMASCGASSSAQFYASTIRGYAALRRVIGLAGEAAIAAYESDIDRALGHIETALDGQDNGTTAPLVGDLLDDHLDLLERRERGEIVSTPTGIVDLDDVLGGGLKNGELYVFAGRPGMGKSVIGGEIAAHAAGTLGKRTLFASLEMSKSELLDRWIGGQARVNTLHLQRGRLDEPEWIRITSSIPKINEWALRVLDRSEVTVAEIRSAAMSYSAELVVVDYLGLVRPAEKRQNRQEEVAQIARSLKAMARRLDCPVVALAQLNRGVESRLDKRPALSDLRESGEVEQSAGAVVMLYRGHYYDQSVDPGVIELLVVKNRHGRLHNVEAAWLDTIQRVANIAPTGGIRSVS